MASRSISTSSTRPRTARACGRRPSIVVASGRAIVDGLDIMLGDDGMLEVGDELVINPRPD